MHRVTCECAWTATFPSRGLADGAASRHRTAHAKETAAHRVAARAVSMRLAIEAARSRGRMYMADPISDPKKAYEVVAEMVALLDIAPDAEYGGYGVRVVAVEAA